MGRHQDVEGDNTDSLRKPNLCSENHDSRIETGDVRILFQATLCLAGFPIMWGIIARTRVKKDGRKPKQLWHDLLSEFTNEFNGSPFFGGEKPDLVDLAAFGYMRSISPFPQFSQLEDHENGMAWYRRIEATLVP